MGKRSTYVRKAVDGGRDKDGDGRPARTAGGAAGPARGDADADADGEDDLLLASAAPEGVSSVGRADSIRRDLLRARLDRPFLR